ncbi:Tat (twin-arginine translocation) pathway signal sequence [Lentzea fradiae]|uniref:Tat (Twin-arginine translocation) pathway signal sequence n=1 Tax=Lentzea fradiae TaxID=200378 RepID=A0A1G7V7P2_9PSEU|nr:FAD-binding oxidoreductase [Lentzea fradiae]SDG55531.1 Tat (twin-arginine translocation) pathway signal sequence [Lentzea fradiae]
MDRRGFLKAAGLTGAGAVLAACTATPPPGSAPPSTPPPFSSSVPSGPPDWAALRARLTGGLALPDGDDFAYQGFNPVWNSRKPAAVARVASAADVQACVEAVRLRAPIAARSGGHSYAGYSTPENGLQVDLRDLADVEVLPGDRVRIGAGAALGDVSRVLAASGRCLPTGTCPSVGVAGLTLGGGIGVLTRKYGLTCDHLVSATVVTADGRLVTASGEQEPDLFWALRGGGGGNFGIVTEFVFTTVPAPEVAVFTLEYPAGAAADVLGAWQSWLADVPDELWSNLNVRGGTPPACRVVGCFTGSAAALNGLLSGLPAPSGRFVEPRGWTGAVQYFAGTGIEHESFVASSRVVRDPIADPARAVELMEGQASESYLIFDGLRGAVARVAPDATAFPHRAALASAQIYFKTPPSGATETARAVGQVRDGLGALVGDTGYVNYIDPKMPKWAEAYYGGNLARLREVAAKYDPDGVFEFAQAVR